MLRLIYTALLYVAAPLALGWTAWRGRRDPLYRDRLGERLGYSLLPPVAPGTDLIWVHAVSVGEVQAAAALVRTLLRRYPDRRLLMTTATPTGAQRVKALFGEEVLHCYLPYDLPGAVRRFLDRVRPAVAVVMETEIWPNLYRECARRRLRIVLISARLSEKSVRRFRRIAGLFREALQQDLLIGAQTEVDAERFIAVGADRARVRVIGNLKFDLEVPPQVRRAGEELRAAQFAGRFVWVAGSTHEVEEELLLQAHRQVRQICPSALLVLVPRHPNRFERVRHWLAAQNGSQDGSHVTRSSGKAVTPQTSVLLVDTLGELLLFYAAADVAFVGGSLVPIGGHNLLEPAALACPILTGPHNFNAPDVARLLLERGAAVQVASAAELAATLTALEADPPRRHQMGAAALATVEANRGALTRALELIEPLLSESGSVLSGSR